MWNIIVLHRLNFQVHYRTLISIRIHRYEYLLLFFLFLSSSPACPPLCACACVLSSLISKHSFMSINRFVFVRLKIIYDLWQAVWHRLFFFHAIDLRLFMERETSDADSLSVEGWRSFCSWFFPCPHSRRQTNLHQLSIFSCFFSFSLSRCSPSVHLSV